MRPKNRRLLAGTAAHSLFSALVASATVAMLRLRHLNRSAKNQVAPDTNAAAVNPIKLPALCPPSARVVAVVAQTRDVTTPGTAVIPMLGQTRRIITVRTPPGQGVEHRDDVDLHDHLSDSTRIPHCPLFFDIMQGACLSGVQHFTCTYLSLFFPSIFASPLYIFRNRCYCTRAYVASICLDVLSMFRICVYVIISFHAIESAALIFCSFGTSEL
jgi:hypothetical protein